MILRSEIWNSRLDGNRITDPDVERSGPRVIALRRRAHYAPERGENRVEDAKRQSVAGPPRPYCAPEAAAAFAAGTDRSVRRASLFRSPAAPKHRFSEFDLQDLLRCRALTGAPTEMNLSGMLAPVCLARFPSQRLIFQKRISTSSLVNYSGSTDPVAGSHDAGKNRCRLRHGLWRLKPPSRVLMSRSPPAPMGLHARSVAHQFGRR